MAGLKTTKNKGLAGVRVSDVRIRFNNFDEVGEILFKEDGISGIVIFNLSAYLARNNFNTGMITIDLLAKVEQNLLLNMIQSSVNHNPNYSLIDILEGILHKSLAKYLLEKLSLDRKQAKDATLNDIQKITNMIKNFNIEFRGYADNNQVHTGGVDLKDLDYHFEELHLYKLESIPLL